MRVGIVLALMAPAPVTSALAQETKEALPRDDGEPKSAQTAPESREAAAIGRVRVVDADGKPLMTGAGAFVDEAYFITSLQVIDRGARAQVVSACCGEFEVEGVVAVDEARDLVLLRVKGAEGKVKALEIAPEPPGKDGEVKVALIVQGAGVVLAGNRALSLEEWPGYGRMIHVNMPLSPLLSTTPVLDGQGRLCGIVVTGGGNNTSLGSVVTPGMLRAGEMVSLERFRDREASNLVKARREMVAGIEKAEAHAYARAIPHYRRAIELDAELWRAHWLLGVALDSIGETEESIPPIRRAAEICPRFSEAAYSLGLVHLKLGKAREAIGFFDRTIELDPEYANAYGMKGAALHQLGEVDAAVASVRRATEVDPDNITHVKNLTFMCQDNEHKAELPAAWRRYCKEKPDDAEGWLMLGSFLDPEEDSDEWIRAYQKAAKIDPENEQTQLRLGMGLLIARRLDEAETAINRCLELDPKNKTAAQVKKILEKERKERGKGK